jgi:hypothetical protein
MRNSFFCECAGHNDVPDGTSWGDGGAICTCNDDFMKVSVFQEQFSWSMFMLSVLHSLWLLFLSCSKQVDGHLLRLGLY